MRRKSSNDKLSIPALRRTMPAKKSLTSTEPGFRWAWIIRQTKDGGDKNNSSFSCDVTNIERPGRWPCWMKTWEIGNDNFISVRHKQMTVEVKMRIHELMLAKVELVFARAETAAAKAEIAAAQALTK